MQSGPKIMCCILTCAALTLRAAEKGGREKRGEGEKSKEEANKEATTCPGATLSLNVSVGGFYCTARFGHQSLIG